MLVICLFKIIINESGSIKGFDYSYSRDSFLKVTYNLAHKRLRCNSTSLKFSAYISNYYCRKRKGQKCHNRKFGRHIKKTCKEAYNKERLTKQYMKTVCHPILHLSHIA